MFGGRILDKEGYILDILEDALYKTFNEDHQPINESIKDETDFNKISINDEFDF